MKSETSVINTTKIANEIRKAESLIPDKSSNNDLKVTSQ